MQEKEKACVHTETEENMVIVVLVTTSWKVKYTVVHTSIYSNGHYSGLRQQIDGKRSEL